MLDRLSKKKRNIGLVVVLALIGWFFWTILSVLNPLILGYLLAFVLHPAVLHLERKRGWSRRRAVNVIFLVAALFVTGTIAGIYLQGKQLAQAVATANREDDVLRRAEERVDAFLAKARTLSDRLVVSKLGRGKVDEGAPSADAAPEPGAPSEAGSAPASGAGADAERSDGAAGPPSDAPEPPGQPVPGAPTAPAAGETAGQATEPTTGAAVGEAAGAAAGAAGAGEPAQEEVPAGDGPAGDGPGGADAEVQPDLTLRDLVSAWWTGYVARNEGGAGAVALKNAPAVLVVLINFFGSIVSIATLLLLLPIYGYFLLFELERIHRFVRRHVPKDERERITRIGTQIGEVIANFFRGRLLICILKGGVITIGLLLAGAPYPLFFGVLAGLMSLVPFVGPVLTFVVALLFGLQELTLVSAVLWIGGTFLAGEILEGYVFIPKILGETLGLHPVVVLVSVFAGGAALGMFGFLIAIPLTAALVILARELLLPALRQFADEDSHIDPPRGAPALAGSGPAAPQAEAQAAPRAVAPAAGDPPAPARGKSKRRSGGR
ncbi:MAG: AI-2E family transporter [Planctomycetota bacterium]